MNYPDLRTDQVAAIRALVDLKGKRWKKAVRGIWSAGIALTDAEVALYQLRNTHGHGWLIHAKTAGFEVRS